MLKSPRFEGIFVYICIMKKNILIPLLFLFGCNVPHKNEQNLIIKCDTVEKCGVDGQVGDLFLVKEVCCDTLK